MPVEKKYIYIFRTKAICESSDSVLCKNELLVKIHNFLNTNELKGLINKKIL